MPRLTPCSSCHAHVFVDDRRCPHCGAELRTSGAPRVAAVAAGLMLSGCVIIGDPEPEYGVPTTTEPPPTTTAETEGDTEGDTDAATEGATTTASTGAESGGSDTGASTGGTAADSTSGPEPDYGVPTTSG